MESQDQATETGGTSGALSETLSAIRRAAVSLEAALREAARLARRDGGDGPSDKLAA